MRKKTVPKYRRQLDSKGSRAFVELAGVRHYLGPCGSSESRERYARIIAEWESNGHQPAVAKDEITVMELCAHFWDFAQGYANLKQGQADFAKVYLERIRKTADTSKAAFRVTAAKDLLATAGIHEHASVEGM